MSRQDGKAPGPGRLVKLCADVPGDVNTRVYHLAGELGIPKRVLVAKLLDEGLRRYHSDRKVRELIAGLTLRDGEAA